MSTLLRFKCPDCGRVSDIPCDGPCPRCRIYTTLPVDGVIQIYRKGHAIGAALDMKLFINEIPLGYLKNMQSIRIPVPYSHYSIRLEYMKRKFFNVSHGIPIEFDITPNNRIVHLKTNSSFTMNSSTVSLEFSRPEDMPPLTD